MFHRKGRGGHGEDGSRASRQYQPHHSKGRAYTPEEQEELIEPLNTGMMEALVNKNEQTAHQGGRDPFAPSDGFVIPADSEPTEQQREKRDFPPPDDSPREDGNPLQPADDDDDFGFGGFGSTASGLQAGDGESRSLSGDDARAAGAHADEALPDEPPAGTSSSDSAPSPGREAASSSDGGAAPPRASGPAHLTASEVNPTELSRYQRDGDQYVQRRALRHRKKRAIAGALVCVMAIFCVFGGMAFAWWQSTANNISLDDNSIREHLSDPVVSEPYWTLILGSDSRNDSQAGSRSDVILLARGDPAAKRVTLVSIPRDTKVTINGETMKINAAYGVGGASQAIQTIEEFAGIDIAHYVEIYFDGFSDLVDQLGGVTVDVPQRASYNGITIEPGLQTLDGEQALTLARNRKTYADGDFTRTECQRLLVQALVSKVLQQDPAQIPGTLGAVSNCFSTDIPLQDLITLATSMQGMGADSFYMAMAPSTTGMIGNASYTFTYINQWKLIMEKACKGEDPVLSEEEIKICGMESTQEYDLDMSMDLPEDIRSELEEYWQEQAKQALAEQEGAAQAGSASEGAIASEGDGPGEESEKE